eukprot:78928_1
MQPQNKKPKKRVSFANHAMVLDFQKEDPTEKIKWNAQTEAALSGSYLSNNSPHSNDGQPIQQPSYQPHHPPHQPHHPPRRSYSLGSSDSNDDRFLANTFSSPQPQSQHYNHRTFRLSPHPNAHHAVPMDIEEDDDDDDDEMELTGTYAIPQTQTRRHSTPRQMDDLRDLYEDTVQTNQMESLQDLFNNDDDTQTDCIPPVAPSIPSINDSGIVNNESTSFNTATGHLQIKSKNNKQSTNAFDGNRNSNNTSMSMQNEQDTVCTNTNNGSFSNHANTTMPALESPINEQINDNNDNNTSSFFASPNANTNTMTVDTDGMTMPIVVNTPDEDHTLRVSLPAHLMNTPDRQDTESLMRTKRRSSTDFTQQVRPEVDSASPDGFNRSLLSDVSSNVGSVTKCFRNQVVISNEQQIVNANNEENEDAADVDTSFNTLLHNAGELLHEKYGMVQQNDVDVHAEEIRYAAPDRNQIRDGFREHQYQVTTPINTVNEDAAPPQTQERKEDVMEEEKEEINWREIAAEYEWFTVEKQKAPKYSLGLGISEQNTQLNYRVLKERKDVILQEVCDNVEYSKLKQFAQEMDDNAVHIGAEIEHLENKMDANAMNDVVRENIEKYGMNQGNSQQLAEYFKLKHQTDFDELKLKCLGEINDSIAMNCQKLASDLEALNQIYNDLDNECNAQKNNINALKECESNPYLRNLQQKIFENDTQIDKEQLRQGKWNEMLAFEHKKTHRLKDEIADERQGLAHLKERVERGGEYENDVEVIASAILLLHRVSGIKINQMTSNKIELILLRWVSFCMEYDAATHVVSNVQFTKHPSPKYTDAFSKDLIDMTYEIGNVLNIKQRVKTISDLKAIIWDIVELMAGVTELRRTINKILQLRCKVVISPYKNGGIRLAIKNTVEYTDNNSKRKMRSSLLVQSVFSIKIGYPNNRLCPQIGVVLVRYAYDEETAKYKSVKDRVPQMLIEQESCALLEAKLAQIKLGTHLFTRCANLIKSQMDHILANEANQTYIQY